MTICPMPAPQFAMVVRNGKPRLGRLVQARHPRGQQARRGRWHDPGAPQVCMRLRSSRASHASRKSATALPSTASSLPLHRPGQPVARCGWTWPCVAFTAASVAGHITVASTASDWPLRDGSIPARRSRTSSTAVTSVPASSRASGACRPVPPRQAGPPLPRWSPAPAPPAAPASPAPPRHDHRAVPPRTPRHPAPSRICSPVTGSCSASQAARKSSSARSRRS